MSIYIQYKLKRTKKNFTRVLKKLRLLNLFKLCRGGSRTAATSKMEHIVIIVNDIQPLTIITKRSIFDVAAVVDPPLLCIRYDWTTSQI